ncbi:scarecrow-like protein 28 isoform X1 [Aristolochia californica]|uniref:scarecrow-like protein 28 isoform X1 n=2 Tax=Aristolochia californica TaxID=171875 RepID=UPI0035D8E7FE
MLAGCPTLLSPRHRLSSEASAQFQACHYQLGSMNSAQRLDLPRSFTHKEAAPRSQSSRPVGLLVEVPVETRKSCSIRPNVRVPSPISSTQTGFWDGRGEIEDRFWERGKNLKRFSEHSSSEDTCINRAKRKRSSSVNTVSPDDSYEGDGLSINQMDYGGDYWFNQTGGDPRPVLGITSLGPSSAQFSTSSEEETICFMNRDAILPPLPLSKSPWVETKGDKDVNTSEEEGRKTNPTSSSSSETDSSARKLKDSNSPENETGNGSHVPYPSREARVAGEEQNQAESLGLELVALLVACVESIRSKNFSAINQHLARLGELASPSGATPIHRVVAYFTEALAIRITKMWPHIFHITIPREMDRAEDDVATSFRLLNHISPIPKFLHYTSNEIILRAFDGKDRVHIIDFDLKQGLQWTGLFQSLASRPNPPSHVRITGIGESKQDLQDTGDRLAGFAEALNLPFEFHAVVDRLEDVRLWMLHVKEGEFVAVNCILQLHKLLYDESGGSLKDFLGLIRSTNPSIVLVGEQEAAHSHPRWENRFLSTLKYYSAIFDSIDSGLPLDSPARIKVEEMFAREIRNILACEGSERVERHETSATWSRLMEEGGFRNVRIEDRETLQSRMLLKMFSCENYRVEKQGENDNGLTLKWLDQSLYTVSSWEPIEFGGSSSSI